VQPGSISREVVTDLAAYRKRKSKTEEIEVPQVNAEETIVEIAKYVMLIVEAITRQRH
jgi:ribonuclease D